MIRDAYRGIFVSDLDGTLLRNGRISEDDRGALADLRAHGVLRVIATGRSLHSALKCLAEDFPVDYLILSTGNQIMDWKTREVLRSSRLPGEDVRAICSFLRGLGISFMVHDDFPHNHSFAYHRGEARVEDFERRLAIYAQAGREGQLCQAMPAASQIVAIVDAGREALHEHVARSLENHSVIRATSPLDGRSVWIEIFAANVSKASGIRHIVEHHALHGALLAAIGNDHNDRDMLDLAHVPFKVDGAFLDDDDRYITTPDNNGAVAFAVAHYMEILNSGMKQA